MRKLGLCCRFVEAPIRFRGTTVQYVSTLSDRGKNPLEYLSKLIEENLNSLSLGMNFCSEHGIGSFYTQSGFFPLYTHPTWGYHLDDLPRVEKIRDAFEKAKREANEKTIRLTFHPDQFIVLNSPKEEVVEKSLADLEYHGLLAKLVGADVYRPRWGRIWRQSDCNPPFCKKFQTAVQRSARSSNCRK